MADFFETEQRAMRRNTTHKNLGDTAMPMRYPLWMIVAFIGEILAAAVFAFFVIILSSAFSGVIPPKAWPAAASPIVAVAAFGLSFWQFRKGDEGMATKLLLLAPAYVALSLLVAVVWASLIP